LNGRARINLIRRPSCIHQALTHRRDRMRAVIGVNRAVTTGALVPAIN